MYTKNISEGQARKPLKTKLLCTFTPKEFLVETIQEIRDNYRIDGSKIFVLKDLNRRKNQYILSYNIIVDESEKVKPIQNTIFVHRNKETDTLYTIDAINRITEEETGINEPNPDHRINWSKYTMCLLTAPRGELSIIKTELESIQSI